MIIQSTYSLLEFSSEGQSIIPFLISGDSLTTIAMEKEQLQTRKPNKKALICFDKAHFILASITPIPLFIRTRKVLAIPFLPFSKKSIMLV